MTSREIRRAFLEYFEQRDHRIVPSSPLVLPNDPTLLFANAGMNQFKDVFTGRERRDYHRATSVQKCLRVSGKHNDLEMVGRTPRHHTFFEMLGNFSFGDYFKREAIRYAWEMMTELYGLPAERLWVTVFEGTDKLEGDQEALRLWRDDVGFPAERILQLGESENFWRMGDTGPCGPCSEIHYDLGEDLRSVEGESNPGTDDRRYVEIWNLVFMQFDQKADGTLEPLPSPSVDTGMGLERIAAVLQDKRNNFDTDLFSPLMDAAAERAGVRRGASDDSDFALRVIADHSRALCFLVADGVIPSKEGRGYVLRRLLRRAIRFGRKLGIDEPFLHHVTPVVFDQLGEVYPELLASKDAILEVGRLEEERFAETLTIGLGILEESLAKLDTSSPEPTLSGKVLFGLHDTYGFPLELARDIASERGVVLDEAGFDAAMQKQRERAQASWKGARAEETAPGVYSELAAHHRTTFEGYGTVRIDDVRVLAIVREGQSVSALEEGQRGEVVLEATPFYAEAGGQVADSGFLVAPNGRAAVTDVRRPVPGFSVHHVSVETGRIAVDERIVAEVNEARRDAVRRNHTATHLVHAALREVVGTHVKQAGSLVAPDRLRFDFSHFTGVSERAISDIESLVNRKVLDDIPVETAEMELEDALKSGAMALFGEKYTERVRVVRIGDFSLELCGGTHTERSGQIGLVKLIQERGVAAGTRRVEAVTGEGSLDRFREAHAIVRGLEEQLSVSRDQIALEIGRRLDQLRELQRSLEAQRMGVVRQQLAERAATPQVVAGTKVVAERVDGVDPAEMRELADGLRRKLGSGVVVLGRAAGDKVSVLVAVTGDLTGRIHAGKLVRRLGKIIGGGGGGRPDMAEAGGKDPSRLDEALGAAVEAVGECMEASG